MEAAGQERLIFEDVAIYFTQEEWRSLEEWKKEMYKEVMMDNFYTLLSLGTPIVKPEVLLLIEGGEEPCVQGHPRWEEMGCEPQAAPGVVRKRCGRRSPNFSRVELESFVSLMDRFLPEEVHRTGAISLRQRRSILQEIARRLEPMSGCLRTPRQLLHRWADFNNRDPERLMEIRMQLHFANSQDQSWDSSDVQTSSSLGRRWRRRTSRPLSSSSSSSSFSEEGEEAPLTTVWDEELSESSNHYFPALPEPPPQNSLTTHIDAQGRYIHPPPLPKSEESWWQCYSGEWMEEQSGLQGSPAPVERCPRRVPSATLYSSLHEQDSHGKNFCVVFRSTTVGTCEGATPHPAPSGHVKKLICSPLPGTGDAVMDLDPGTHAGFTAPVPGLRTIKSEPDSEEDEGGGSWSSDVPSLESVMYTRSRRRKGREAESSEQLSPALVSADDSYALREPADGGLTAVKLEPDCLSGPCSLESPMCTEQEDSPGGRSIKRSPNFSPAELECFVALMDHFLPGNLIRAGALPIRQRKSILQEIARRLEPLSGCLRTPRQLRHRWTDFNNRDPDRLEEIRRRLRRAARQDSYKKSSKEAESAPATGNNWRRRRYHRLQRNIKEEEQETPEQMRPDITEEDIPRIPWRHHGLPKLRNSFSMARLKKNRPLQLHILSIDRLLQQVDQRQDLRLQRDDLSTDEEDCAGLN